VEETQQLEPGPGANSDVQQQGDMEAEQPGKDANDGNSNATMGEESDLSEKESSVDQDRQNHKQPSKLVNRTRCTDL